MTDPGSIFPPLPATLFDDLLGLPDGRPVATTDDWALKRDDIRRRFLALLGTPPASRPPPVARVIEETDVGLYRRRKIAYAVEEDEEAEAWLLLPKGCQEPLPAVLCLHGTTPDGKDQNVGLSGDPSKWIAHDLALRGFATLSPDHFCTGARTPPEGHYETAAFYRRHPGWSAVGKAIWEESAAVDVLQAQPEVDGARIGCIGHSLGGHGTLFFAAADERVAAAVCNCGATTWRADDQRLNWSRDHWYVYLPALRESFLQATSDARQGVPVDIPEIVALIAPRAFLDISVLNDNCYSHGASVHLRDAWWKLSELYNVLGAPERFACLTHRGGHSFPHFARACAYSWLEQQLMVG